MTTPDVDAIETRAILAHAYPSGHRGPFLTHAVHVDGGGNPRRILCGGPMIENLADRFATDPIAPPTCKRCAKALTARTGGDP